MKLKKTVRQIVSAQSVPLGPERVMQPLPNDQVDQIDPFLLIHHASFSVQKGAHPRNAGVGPHPHRGFSPVTFIFEGSIHHRDSLNNSKVVYEGGTQWMHAGRGITHSERPGKEMIENGGANEIIQFWVNTPSAHKMDAPFYQPISKEDTPVILKENAEIAVVAGELDGVKGPAKALTPLTLLRINLKESASVELDIRADFNTLLYVLNGSMEINGSDVRAKQLVWFHNDGERLEISASEDTRAILLSGAPIGEEVAKYGPFVMNTQTEIMEALRDSQMGKMGVLIEEF